MTEKARKQDVAHAARTPSNRDQAGQPENRDEAIENTARGQSEAVDPASGPGQLATDDRGNMSWEWADDPELQADDLLGRTARLRALAPGHLSLVEETGEFAAVKKDPIPVRKKPPGYNPYDSGEPSKRSWKKKRDLREFSKWISLKKRLKKDSGEEP
jgi:hypothetical protein